MIEDLIVKLTEKTNEEVAHKGWCDTYLSTTEQMQKEKMVAVEAMTAESAQPWASIAKLVDDSCVA